MGFVRSTVKLVFDDPQFEGLEVKSRRLSAGVLLTISRMRNRDWNGDGAVEGIEEFAGLLVTALTGWNLEDEDGTAVPLTARSLADVDYKMLFAISDALLDASAGVSPPLSPPSSDGSQSVEASIPMETLSPSPAS
jgi:hypothetical protein